MIGNLDRAFPKVWEGCFIDLDGTLLDSSSALYTLYQRFLGDRGRQGTKEEYEELNGLPLYRILLLLNDRYDLHLTRQEVEAAYNHLLENYYHEGPEPFASAIPVLELLSSHAIPMAIVTAASESYTRHFLDKHGLLHFFAAITTAEEVGRGKPDPAIYRRALDVLGIFPEEAVAIEDSYNGVMASSEAGICTLWIFGRETMGRERVFPVDDWQNIYHLFVRQLKRKET